jgi:hypothetical protein
MKTNYSTNESGNSMDGYSNDFQALSTRLQDLKRGLQLKLAGSGAGRIVLHLILAVVTCHFAWHYQGIVRELARH